MIPPRPSREQLQTALHGLYPITPDDYLLPRLSAHVAMALRGGVKLIQYRNKSAPPPLKRAQAAEMLRLTRAEGALLIINDDLPLALDIGADGVHLGATDGDLVAARAALGPGHILGVSCYADLARAEAAAAAGADYLAFGAAFPSRTKPHAPALSLDIIQQAKTRFGLPVAVVGGITLYNAATVIAAGADMVAVITDLFDAMDLASHAAAFQDLFTQDHA